MTKLTLESKLKHVLEEYLMLGIHLQVVTMDDAVNHIKKLFEHGKCIDCAENDTCDRSISTMGDYNFEVTYCSEFKEKS